MGVWSGSIYTVMRPDFVDNGFRNIATGNFQRFEERSDRGSLNENFVIFSTKPGLKS